MYVLPSAEMSHDSAMPGTGSSDFASSRAKPSKIALKRRSSDSPVARCGSRDFGSVMLPKRKSARLPVDVDKVKPTTKSAATNTKKTLSRLLSIFVQVTPHVVVGLILSPANEARLGHDATTGFEHVRTARVEATTAGRFERRRQFTLQSDWVQRHVRIRDRIRGKQRPSVRVLGRAEQVAGRRDYHQFAQVHHRDAIGDAPHHVQIVADEQIGQPKLRAQISQEIQDLRLNRNIERGHGFVADDELGFERERPRDAHALPLPARKLVRIAAAIAAR